MDPELSKKIESSLLGAEAIANILMVLFHKRSVSSSYFLNRYNLTFADLINFEELTGAISFIPGKPVFVKATEPNSESNHRLPPFFPEARWELTAIGIQVVNYLKGIK